MNYIQVGKLIRTLRNEKNISMNDLAQKLVISQASVSRIEGGLQEVNFTMLNKICEQFEISLSTFFLLLEQKIDINLDTALNEATTSKTEDLDEELYKIIRGLSEDQKKGLYVLLLPYLK
ncbi:helix-turn-helix domain-containing protein [Solibacillus daqui]|uniref:helix-turn-helix domain-containing protein n=1 Tax=Solibacillus daqui TaxID=2912187 RepID=UPI002365C26D|nr:helix-turn-helix transcriptional regulator [Solibacillus daqui]